MRAPLQAATPSGRRHSGPRAVPSASAGYLLVEFLLYIAVLAVVMGVAFKAFYRTLDNARDLARTSDDVLRTTQAGELWRADIRRAIEAPRLVTEGELVAFEIEQPDGLIVYVFADRSIWRQQAGAAPKQLLPRVHHSQMVPDQGKHVTSWRWELELLTRKQVVRIRPLFTFQAVAGVK